MSMLLALSRLRHARHDITTSCLLGFYRWSSTITAKQYDPLRILFCGADEFSIFSLRALNALQQKRPENIASIEVLCRPDKRAGRGLKNVREVPIKRVSSELGLRLHQVDKLKDWSPPNSIDLIVAVSFGLLIPARLLQEAKYGGLNVHPSLLPEFRGAAPIQRALLSRRATTGVTLQTMHPTRFDHGAILDQVEARIEEDAGPEQLIDILGRKGASMLAKGVEDGIFVPPLQPFSGVTERKASYAPKLTPEDHHITWETWTADEILLRSRVLHRLWDTVTYVRCAGTEAQGGSTKRVTFSGSWTKTTAMQSGPSGLPVSLEDGTMIGFHTCDGYIVAPDQVIIDGLDKARSMRKLAQAVTRKAEAP